MTKQVQIIFAQIIQILSQRVESVRNFFQLKESRERAFVPEKEFRFPIERLPKDFLDYLKSKKWSEEAAEVDIVLMHPDEDGFVARLRKSNNCYLQFKIRREERLWDEVSIPISVEEVIPIFETLKEFLEPKVIVSKKRKFFNESDKLKLYMDTVENLGTFVEIESEDQSADTFMQKFNIDAGFSAEPYGKLLLQKPFDIEKNVEKALNQMTSSTTK